MLTVEEVAARYNTTLNHRNLQKSQVIFKKDTYLSYLYFRVSLNPTLMNISLVMV